jgi:hypothetical protein
VLQQLRRIAPHVIQRMKADLIEDLGIIYGMGVRNPQEPAPEEARKLVAFVTAPHQLYWLAHRSGVGLHTESAITTDYDMAAAIIAAFYARIRCPHWVAHPDAANTARRASQTVDGRVLAVAAQTLCQSLVACGYRGNFEGSPSEVADAIRAWMKATS